MGRGGAKRSYHNSLACSIKYFKPNELSQCAKSVTQLEFVVFETDMRPSPHGMQRNMTEREYLSG